MGCGLLSDNSRNTVRNESEGVTDFVVMRIKQRGNKPLL